MWVIRCYKYFYMEFPIRTIAERKAGWKLCAAGPRNPPGGLGTTTSPSKSEEKDHRVGASAWHEAARGKR